LLAELFGYTLKNTAKNNALKGVFFEELAAIIETNRVDGTNLVIYRFFCFNFFKKLSILEVSHSKGHGSFPNTIFVPRRG